MEHELENSGAKHRPIPSTGRQGWPCVEEPMEESTDLGNASTLLGRFPRFSLLDNTESTVSGLWGQRERQVTLGCGPGHRQSEPQATMILSTVISA